MFVTAGHPNLIFSTFKFGARNYKFGKSRVGSSELHLVNEIPRGLCHKTCVQPRLIVDRNNKRECFVTAGHPNLTFSTFKFGARNYKMKFWTTYPTYNLKVIFFYFLVLPVSFGWMWCLKLWTMSPMFHHCATTPHSGQFIEKFVSVQSISWIWLGLVEKITMPKGVQMYSKTGLFYLSTYLWTF